MARSRTTAQKDSDPDQLPGARGIDWRVEEFRAVGGGAPCAPKAGADEQSDSDGDAALQGSDSVEKIKRHFSPERPQLRGGATLLMRAEAHADHLGDAGLLHGYAVDHVGGLHHALGMSDEQELRVSAKRVQQICQATHVGLVKRSIDFVEHAEGAGLELEDSHQQSQSSERFFSARKQQHILQFLTRWRSHNFKSALGLILNVGKAQEGLSTLEESRENVAEVLVDAGKSLVEFGARNLIDFLDGFLCILDGLH